ncbi:isoprenoid synthase domain-containing protein [Suillus americanus]|nr:isoprenoid synthase domain-containing protein [Suillus americanus]
MDARPKIIYLPDTMIDWPWPRTINPHYEDVKIEVDALIRDTKALSPESLAAFDRANTGSAYFLFLEEYTNISSGAVVQEIVDIGIDVLHNPHKIRPEDECIVGEILRRFWARAIQTASLSCQRHFIETFPAYLHGVAAEVLDRGQVHRHSIDAFLKLRRHTVGLQPCLFIHELEMNLPDEVFYHPVIMNLSECITDLVLIDNDMISYNKEQAAENRDEDHNLISIVMSELGLDIGGAMAWIAHHHAGVRKRFIDGLATVPSWGPSVDILVKKYLDGIAMWPRGNHSWMYEVHRYFPATGMSPEIQQARLVPLLPRPDSEAV